MRRNSRNLVTAFLTIAVALSLFPYRSSATVEAPIPDANIIGELNVAGACGPQALYEMSRILRGNNFLPWKALLSPVPSKGFSLNDLSEMGDRAGLDLIAVRRESGIKLVAPSIVHFSCNHYVAILAYDGDKFVVFDPGTGQFNREAPETINRLASGFFLLQRSRLPNAWRTLSLSERSLVCGRGYATTFLDTNDLFQPTAAKVGLPVWHVSEPYTSLWIDNVVLEYNTSAGAPIKLVMAYRQRGPTTDIANSSFGPQWECSWTSAIRYDIAIFGTWYLKQIDSFDAPLGGVLAYTSDGATPEYNSYTKLSNSFVDHDGTGFTVSYPDGAWDSYTFRISPSGESPRTVTNYLTQRFDSQNRALTFNYITNSLGTIILSSVADYDNRTNWFFYNSSFPNQISMIVDAYHRTNKFFYNGSGLLTNIVNPVGLSTIFAYDSQWAVTNMVSPYGTNTFVKSVTTNSGNFVKRSMKVTESDGRVHLFVYRDQSTYLNTNGTTPLIPFSYPTNQVPSTALVGANKFDNTWMDARNSFYWSPHCYAQLSANFLQTQDFNNLTAADYLLAEMKHWLLQDNTNWYIGHTISMIRQASPDGVTEGQKIWYDYWGKVGVAGTNFTGQAITNYFSYGTNASPSYVAVVLPDGTTRFSRAEYNSDGRTTRTIGTYSSSTGIATRTNTFLYSNANLVAVYGVAGELLATNDYSNHQIVKARDALNQQTLFTYSASRQLTSVVTASGMIISNTFYTSGTYSNFLQNSINLTLRATNSYSYTNGLVYTHTDERGVTTTNTWDALARPIAVSGPNGAMTFRYTNQSLVQTVSPLGHTNTIGYDYSGRPVYAADSLNRTNSFAYYPWGNLQTTTNALGQAVRVAYDNLGRTTVVTLPDATSSTNGYDLMGRLTVASDPIGTSVTYKYNNQGLLSAVTGAYGIVSSNAFDIKDRLVATVDASGVTNLYGYDLLNRVVGETNGMGRPQFFGYNAFGLSSYTNELSQSVYYGRDAAGQLTSETNANGEVVQTFYDSSGNVTNVLDGKNQSTKWSYDQYGRATNKVDALGGTILAFAYDPEHKLTNRWSAAKGNTRYSYDAVGNLIGIIYSNSPSIAMQYDPLNRVTNMVDAIGSSQFQYASFGALLNEQGPWADDTVTYSYTANHLLSGASLLQPNASPWSQAMTYDSGNRIQTITSPAGSFTYSYLFAGGRVKNMTIPNGSYITNSFDVLGRPAAAWLKNSSGAILDSDIYSYDLAGQVTNHVRPDGSYVNFTYDNIGQLKIANAFESGGTARKHEKFGFTYDPAGNLAYRTNNALVQTFSLNNLNQLTSSTHNGTLTVAGTTTSSATNVAVNGAAAAIYQDKTFAKDALTIVNGVNTFTASAQDNLGRTDTNTIIVTLPTTVNFAYDLNGNFTSDGSRAFDYDDDNELIRVTVTNSWKAEYKYDGFGRRRILTEYAWVSGSWVQTNQVLYVFGGNFVLQERGPDNLPRVSYTRGPDLSGSFAGAGGIGGLLARTDMPSGQHSYYRSDASGNVTSLINTQQCFVAKYLYDPFGDIVSKSGPLADANLYRFSSKEVQVNSGLYYFGQRFYDPSLQRWLNRDPLEESGGLNLYAFAGNASLNGIDPWGLLGLVYNNGGGVDYDEFFFGGDSGGTSETGGDEDGPLEITIVKIIGEKPTPPKPERPGPPLSGSDFTVYGNVGEITYRNVSGGSFQNLSAYENRNSGGTSRFGGPHGVLSFVPIVGEALSAADSLRDGHPIIAGLHAGLALTDIFLVKGIAVGVAKAGIAGIVKLTAEGATEAAARGTVSTAEQLANLARFEKNLPANATPSKIFNLPNGGKAFQANSPAKNIPGSFAQYEKQVDAAGKTLQYTKTTFGPKGEIIHVKDKIAERTFILGE